jgi:hypothetical protein
MIEICESKEGLDILNLPRLWPVYNSLDFLVRHGKAILRQKVTKVLHGHGMEFTFFGFRIKPMLAEASKYFSDVILMGCEVLGIYKDVIQIDDNTYVKHISEDAIDKPLEGSQCIGETLGHNQPFMGAIAHM